MGMDARATGQSYQRQGGYHRSNYRSENYGGNYGNTAGEAPRKYGHGGMQYDSGAKYDSSKFDKSASDQVTGTGNAGGGSTAGGYQNGNRAAGAAGAAQNGGNSGNSSQNGSVQAVQDSAWKPESVPATSIAALEKKLAAAQAEMTQALQDSTSKEHEKFDLIFSILIELQTRQGKLEESVKSLKAHFEPMNGQPQMTAQPGQQQIVMQVPQASGQGQMNGQIGVMNNQMVAQVGQMGQQIFVGGQMGMNQQFGNAIMAQDGSGAFFAPVMMAMPQNGGQIQYVQQMMPQGVAMQAMPQMVQFIGQDEFHWNSNGMGGNMGNMQNMGAMPMGNSGNLLADGNASANEVTHNSNGASGSGAGTARSSVSQPAESAGPQDAQVTAECKADKMDKMDRMIHEEE